MHIIYLCVLYVYSEFITLWYLYIYYIYIIFNCLIYCGYLYIIYIIHIYIYIHIYGYPVVVTIRYYLSTTWLHHTAGPDPHRRWTPVHLHTAAAEDGVAECWLTRGRFVRLKLCWLPLLASLYLWLKDSGLNFHRKEVTRACHRITDLS